MKIEKFKLEEWMNKYEASALYDLTTTCISPLSIDELLSISKTKSNIFKTKLGYGDIEGSLRLKNAIKSLYSTPEIDNITITHGAIGANQLIFLSLIENGDEVVSIIPTYQQHYSIPKSLGANVKVVFLKEENNWLPNLKELEKFLTPKTKLLCLNNPNNPTGSVIPNEMLEEIVDLAKKNNIWILSDEVYRGLSFDNPSYGKSIADIYEKGISVGSMSKTYSLPGLRVGWIVADKHLINEINHQRQYNTISISILDDYFSAIALENKEAIEKRNLIVMQEGLQILKEKIQSTKFLSCKFPKGGTTALVKYNLDIPSREFCKKVQRSTGVALLPGETLEMEGYVRIGFCVEKSILAKALDKVIEFCNNL